MKRYIFVGECRSQTAIDRGWKWTDGRLAAAPLFEALRAAGIDPNSQEFVNLFRDPPGSAKVDGASVRKLLAATGCVIVAMGKRVAGELAKRGIVHTPIVHPAARGKIRRRDRYIAHVCEALA